MANDIEVVEVNGVSYERECGSLWADTRTNLAVPTREQEKLNQAYDRFIGKKNLEGTVPRGLSKGENAEGEYLGSPLQLMGYIVGKQGLPKEARRLILKNAFLGELPNAGSRAYMARWGSPGSNQRFYAIAGHIRKCRDEHPRPKHDYSIAKKDWTDDLNWFASKYKPE